ncbi:hypothetical protein SAY87_011162 [Trapa incisa]|uniref:Uncharacterized protein n=2 Tax=Trapa TaxID=22665 RepID=A0AAN7LX55_TRANT|nr:hypothetical protein SAY87_011162 [Trapa incisa]KAK4794232.1 hypothetical protein SAY86_012226 [Trapa natans]
MGGKDLSADAGDLFRDVASLVLIFEEVRQQSPWTSASLSTTNLIFFAVFSEIVPHTTQQENPSWLRKERWEIEEAR